MSKIKFNSLHLEVAPNARRALIKIMNDNETPNAIFTLLAWGEQPWRAPQNWDIQLHDQSKIEGAPGFFIEADGFRFYLPQGELACSQLDGKALEEKNNRFVIIDNNE